MNTAMTLYSAHFHGKPNFEGTEDLKAAILIRNDFKSVILANKDEKVLFSDGSTLIFTYDNVQVSLF
jgi:hypothetical protein